MIDAVRSEQFISDPEITLAEQLFRQSAAECLEACCCRHALRFIVRQYAHHDESSPSTHRSLDGDRERLDFARFASPLHRVHPDAPPFLNVHGTADAVVPYRQSEALADALRAQGVRADLLPVPDAGHCFEGWSDIGGLIEAGIDFLDDVLK